MPNDPTKNIELCLSDADVGAYASASVTLEEADRIEAHLVTCSVCLTRFNMERDALAGRLEERSEALAPSLSLAPLLAQQPSLQVEGGVSVEFPDGSKGHLVILRESSGPRAVLKLTVNEVGRSEDEVILGAVLTGVGQYIQATMTSPLTYQFRVKVPALEMTQERWLLRLIKAHRKDRIEPIEGTLNGPLRSQLLAAGSATRLVEATRLQILLDPEAEPVLLSASTDSSGRPSGWYVLEHPRFPNCAIGRVCIQGLTDKTLPCFAMDSKVYIQAPDETIEAKSRVRFEWRKPDA